MSPIHLQMELTRNRTSEIVLGGFQCLSPQLQQVLNNRIAVAPSTNKSADFIIERLVKNLIAILKLLRPEFTKFRS